MFFSCLYNVKNVFEKDFDYTWKTNLVVAQPPSRFTPSSKAHLVYLVYGMCGHYGCHYCLSEIPCKGISFEKFGRSGRKDSPLTKIMLSFITIMHYQMYTRNHPQVKSLLPCIPFFQ